MTPAIGACKFGRGEHTRRIMKLHPARLYWRLIDKLKVRDREERVHSL